jgi:hypothetical protein
MNRSPLERASWIAGICSAILALYVWLTPQPSQSHKAPVGASNASSVAPPAAPLSAGSGTPATATSVLVQQASAPRVCPKRERIQEALKRVSSFSSSAARDEAYFELHADALCIGDLALAMELSGMPYAASRRDQLVSLTIDAAIAKRQLQLAEMLVLLMSTNGGKDAARKKVLDAIRTGS